MFGCCTQVEALASFLMKLVEQFVKVSPLEVLPLILTAFPLGKCHLQIGMDENCSGASVTSEDLCPLLPVCLNLDAHWLFFPWSVKGSLWSVG